MGYRSQVAGCISVNGWDKNPDQTKFKEMIGFIKLSKFWELWNQEKDNENFGWQDGKFILYGSDWKWYPDYSDVKAWYELWENMQEIKGISGYFCRVGEEHGDTEQDEFGSDPCYDFFYPVSGLHFEGEEFLGKRDTDVEENQADQAPTNPQEDSCGSSVAQSA